MPLLPQELWDRTIDFLAPDCLSGPSKHYADLHICALTCQSWLPRAQRQLYKHVELDRLESTRLLARTLEESPDLCPFVKRLEFWCKKADWESQLTPVGDVPFPAHLIGGLTALHSLRFACCTDLPRHCEVQIDFVNKWRGFKQLRTLWLDGFCFDTLADLTRVIWSFPLLGELNVFQTTWGERNTSVDPAEFPGHCQMLTNVEMQETYGVDDLLPLLGRAIQTLSVAWMWDALNPDTYAAISTLLDLRGIQIQINYLDYAWVASILFQIRSAHLEELVLDLSLLSRDEDSTVLEIFAKEGLDELLSHKPLDGIRRLRIITFGNNKTGKAERRRQEAQALLPQFMKRGTIEVAVEQKISGLTGEEYED
ncbi:hypothetical protein L226DRAFT_256559 [Lentinus tigrinus ALCF2SS1-7]|uniref:F-box domain-containing protein n=1 Tax=Lentinus tigrinus ALCF2SS1-6 TaxID=1328759 RepID=A0A5C2RVU9_9APHY|nr:hypothetical protein L227DRAFT_579822 [Lentinus tigrinus ALCF2SS1-6]RPD70083.1 hypothetical protein L226DRAFT_256559 [Lentinus tigrinus ALCF2SS1-7]